MAQSMQNSGAKYIQTLDTKYSKHIKKLNNLYLIWIATWIYLVIRFCIAPTLWVNIKT